MKQFDKYLIAILVGFMPAIMCGKHSSARIEADASNSASISFLIEDKGKKVPLLTLDCGPHRALGKQTKAKVDYEMTTGKRLHCQNEYVESLYILENGDTLAVRVFKDGVAWKKPGPSSITVVNPAHRWLQEWTEAYEALFPKDNPMDGKRFAYPALFEFKDGIFALLSESGVTPREAGTSMYPEGAEGANLKFSLRPDGPENGGWQTVIAGSLADVVESTLVNDNSAPSRLDDTTWLKPGVAAWVYWAYNHGSNDCDIIAKYTDLAAQLGMPYVLIDAEWDEMKNGKTVEDAVAYAISKGVDPIIWYNSSIGWVDGAPGPKFRLNNPEDREREMAWCEKIGVKGLKIDFFSGDTNRNFKFMDDLLRDAAKHHLMVNFHGATLPRGWQRTWPNFVTNEGVYGAEWYNNLPVLTNAAPAHNATIPFTRNVVASMDYTPCAFSDSQHPHITTHAHELALTVLFESGIQHIADRPESILAQPHEVQEFLGDLPTVWDETILLDGYPGEFAVMARRHGNAWYIAGINGSMDTPRTVGLDLSRLGKTGKEIRLFEDGNPWNIAKTTKKPETMTMQPRGGFIMTVQ